MGMQYAYKGTYEWTGLWNMNFMSKKYRCFPIVKCIQIFIISVAINICNILALSLHIGFTFLVNYFVIFSNILLDDDEAHKHVQLPDDKNSDGSWNQITRIMQSTQLYQL